MHSVADNGSDQPPLVSGANFPDCEALQPPREDRDEGDLDKGDEVVLRTVKDRVQSPVAD